MSAASRSNGLFGAGGDFVDLIACDGRLLAVVGDVSGKGVAASLVAAVVLSSVQHHVALLGARPGALLAAVDNSVCAMLDRTGALVTMAIAVVEPEARTVRLASAGHHPVMLATTSAVSRLGPTCPPLGAAMACRSELTESFERSASLVIVSDGITEQPNLAGEEFGLARLGRLADASRFCSPDEAIEQVLAGVEAHAGVVDAVDDRAIVIVRSEE